MTSFEIQQFQVSSQEIKAWGAESPKHRNWPVVYLLSNDAEVYVGESINAEARIRQHMESGAKHGLDSARVIFDETFNKSACLDLESLLIRMLSGDGAFKVLNSNAGIIDAAYFDRESYRRSFEDLLEHLRQHEHLFKRTIPEIINSDLFKLSPFKALNHDQAIAVEDILDGLFADLESGTPSTVVVQGGPGTGKTVVAIYLLKLIEDIRRHDHREPVDSDSIFSDFFTRGHSELLESLNIGIVVPQQSLRESVARVFALTPGLSKDLVHTPFTVGERERPFDLLIVDEAHRLNQRANQASGVQNKKFSDINLKLFGSDDASWTQLDWIKKQSKHTILLLDTGQSVRPADLPTRTTESVLAEASRDGRLYPLVSQMRVLAGQDYVGYVRAALSNEPPASRKEFEGYDLRFFSDLGKMRQEIHKREAEHGLSRLVAGFAWPWLSKKDRSAIDIEIDDERLRWNSTQRDWINSRNSINEVGSIHTVQGYDLNYAGVIIGKDLRFDPAENRVYFDRREYHDKKGRENNPKLAITYSDEDLLRYVQNIYSVLLTRGILGTYVYVADPSLRSHLQKYF